MSVTKTGTQGRGKIYDSITETIGNTPIVRLNNIGDANGCKANLLAKLEFFNPIASVQSKEITLRQGIPQRYLEQVMQHLVRAGILKGVRGPRGGYLLARERRRISAGDIVRVIGALENGVVELAATDQLAGLGG